MNLLPQPRSLVILSGRLSRGRAMQEPQVQIGVADIVAQGYTLRISPDGIAIRAADEAGAFYARATLEQFRRMHPEGDLPTRQVDGRKVLPEKTAGEMVSARGHRTMPKN